MYISDGDMSVTPRQCFALPRFVYVINMYVVTNSYKQFQAVTNGIVKCQVRCVEYFCFGIISNSSSNNSSSSSSSSGISSSSVVADSHGATFLSPPEGASKRIS